MTIPAQNRIDIIQFLEKSKSIPVIDVRSPSEYLTGHIPGAKNIPLFDDNERRKVGIAYNDEGRLKAILKGLEMIGNKMSSKLEAALSVASDQRLLVHCWRGGMRSETMSWLFSLGSIKTEILEGGYKSYRNYILEDLKKKRKIIVLGGMTGSSKTHILHRIRDTGYQIIDLEALANHKGSAFGSLGQQQQPSSEHFANLLFSELQSVNNDLPVWIEDESRNIGSVFMPDDFYKNIQAAPAVILMLDAEKRIPRLIEEYALFPADQLQGSVIKVSKRLGGENAKKVLESISSGDFREAVRIMLQYYDKTYKFSLRKRNDRNKIYVESDTDNVEENTAKVLEASNKISW
ncbi:MAG: tRNA 2-selenouridine synthase [Bacteroidetes bacterium]|nr:tRNA 2-selenouridine synthase [Bacteroidota bacterium]